MNNDDQLEGLTYAGPTPNLDALQGAYDEAHNNLESYFQLCRRSYDDRRNYWPGKSRDLRKHGADAFPWEGASDMEAHVIGERINHLVALCMTSLEKANIRAMPTNAKQIPRAKIVGNFLKWMTNSGYIPRFMKEMELGANYLMERSVLITYVGWNKEDRSFLQKISLEQMQQSAPEIAEAIISGEQEGQLIHMLQGSFNGVTKARAKKAIKQLQELGVADLPTVRRQVDEPDIKTLAPDGDWIFPSYTTDPQRAPYGFWRTYLTVQELEGKVTTDGWDKGFVDHLIENYRGVNIDTVETMQEGRRSTQLSGNIYTTKDLVEIIYGYQRMIDPIDGSEGIYCTVYHKDFRAEGYDIQDYAKFDLLNGFENYPVVVTRLAEDNKRLYDTQTFPDLLRGLQNQIKVERDSRTDNNSMSTLPPLLHPASNPPSDWGPGRKVPYRRKGELEYGPTPAYNPGSVEMEQTLMQQADRIVGLDEQSGLSMLLRQHLVNKYLAHVSGVLKLAYRNFQRFGPEKVFFQVTGIDDPQEFDKGDPDEEYNVMVKFDVQDTDPEAYDKKQERMLNLVSLDRNGTLDLTELISMVAQGIDPIMAGQILVPKEEAQEKLLKDITDDISKIHAGIEVAARPNGAQAALQIIEQYASQEDVAKKLQEDEAFAERLQKYAGQYQFAMQQQENAQIGRIGTKPAQMGGMKTQGMAQQ